MHESVLIFRRGFCYYFISILVSKRSNESALTCRYICLVRQFLLYKNSHKEFFHMKRNTGRKLLNILLTLALMLGLMPGMSLTAYAATDIYTNLIPTNSDTDTDLTNKQVTFNGYNWYIIADNSTAVNAGTVTLLAAESLGTSVFHGSSNVYSTSTIKDVLDNMTASGGSFAGVASAINTVKVKGSESDAKVDAKLYLLSKDEADNVPLNVRKFSTNWWLCSPVSYNERQRICVVRLRRERQRQHIFDRYQRQVGVRCPPRFNAQSGSCNLLI